MTYLLLYIVGIILIWWTYRVGWLEALKTVVKVIVPSALIILFNIKAGRLLFKSPVVGLLSTLPTSIFIFRGSSPLVSYINNWLEKKINSSTINRKLSVIKSFYDYLNQIQLVSQKVNRLCLYYF